MLLRNDGATENTGGLQLVATTSNPGAVGAVSPGKSVREFSRLKTTGGVICVT